MAAYGDDGIGIWMKTGRKFDENRQNGRTILMKSAFSPKLFLQLCFRWVEVPNQDGQLMRGLSALLVLPDLPPKLAVYS